MKRLKRILCVIDAYDNFLTSVKQAYELAKKNQAELKLIVVIKKAGLHIPFIQTHEDLNKLFNTLLVEKNDELKVLQQNHCQGVSTQTEVLVGIPFIEIIREVLRYKPDVLVKCSNDETWLGRLFGSDDMHILRKCPCPVLMLKPGHIEPCQNILATVDLVSDDFDEEKEYCVQDQLNRRVLELAGSFALSGSAELHIGSVWDSFGENFLRYGAFAQTSEDKIHRYVEQTHQEYSDKLDALARGLKALLGKEAVDYISPIPHLVKGLPAQEIPEMTKKYDIDLIVMGTVARTGIAGLFIGNTAEAILEQVQCSVLAIKPEGFETPVTL